MSDNTLSQIESIRKRAVDEILALGFEEQEIQVDVGISPADSDALYKLAKSLGWQSGYCWYEAPEKTKCGFVTLYYDAPEQVW